MSHSDDTTRPRGRLVVVDVPGIPSDEVAIPRALADHLKTVVDQNYDTIILDVRALTHPDSMTLAAIVQTYVRAVKGGGTVKLTNVTKRFRKLLTVTKLDQVMEIIEITGPHDRIGAEQEPATSKTDVAKT